MTTKVYTNRESDTVWSDSTGDLAMTLNNLAAGAVRVGARKDLGAGSTSRHYEWRLTVQFETAPVVGEVVEVYISTSDGSNPDGGVGTADAAGDTNMIKNCKLIGRLRVTSTDAAHNMTVSGEIRINTRYVSPVVYNRTADNLKATNDVSSFTLTSVPPELQD